MADDEIDLEELLPESDRDFLKEKEFSFQASIDKGSLLLVFKDFSFPPAYAPQTADLLIIIPSGYPNGQLDMFWTIPDVKLANGNWPARSEVHEIHGNKNWQRWSRHNREAWRMGVDDLRTFLRSIRNEISKGI